MSNIGNFLKQKREAAGLSQSQLAKAAGLKYDSKINKIEKGTQRVTWDELGEISKALNNFHVFEALQAAGYISEEDIHPSMKIRRLDALDNNDLQEVQLFVDFLISQKNMPSKGDHPA